MPGTVYQRGTQTSNAMGSLPLGSPYFPYSYVSFDIYQQSTYLPLGDHKFVWTGSWTTDAFSGAVFGPLQYDFTTKRWSPALHAGASFGGMGAGCVTFGGAGTFCVAGGGTPSSNTTMFVDSGFGVSNVIIPQLTVPRSQIAVVSVRGAIYFIGGYTPGAVQSPRIDVFSFGFGYQSTLPAFTVYSADLAAARHAATAVPYTQSRVALVGGYRAFGQLSVDYVDFSGSAVTSGLLGTLQPGFPDGPVSAVPLTEYTFLVASTLGVSMMQVFAYGNSWVITPPSAYASSAIACMASFVSDEPYPQTYFAKVALVISSTVYVWVIPITTTFSQSYFNTIPSSAWQVMGTYSLAFNAPLPQLFVVGPRFVFVNPSSPDAPFLVFDVSDYEATS